MSQPVGDRVMPIRRRRRRWTRAAVVASIQTLRENGADLSYSGAASSRSSLHSAGVRLFGSWHRALCEAGVDADAVRRRRRWNRQAILERIRHLASGGADLSWTAMAHGPERALVAAAVKPSGFGSWDAALGEADVGDVEVLRRSRRWSARTIVSDIVRRRRDGLQLNAKAVERDEPALITAARRTFGSWSAALVAAGIDPDLVAVRASGWRSRGQASGSAAQQGREGMRDHIE